MGWKRREKELTREEALAQAKKEVAPFWHRIAPQFSPVDTSTGVSIFPLEEKFMKSEWIIAFLDLTNPECVAQADYLREWHKRYSQFEITFLVVYYPSGPHAENTIF